MCGTDTRIEVADARPRTPVGDEITAATMAAWSSGMILASGARGPGFNSRSSPCVAGKGCFREAATHLLRASEKLGLPAHVAHCHGFESGTPMGQLDGISSNYANCNHGCLV
jgi:hypothetical protein